MGEEALFPFINPDTCLYNPNLPGEKLCPRCSPPGEVCCAIQPLPEYLREPVLRYLRESRHSSSIEKLSRMELWVCAGRCDERGFHAGRDPRRR
jgi:hypothetical protein